MIFCFIILGTTVVLQEFYKKTEYLKISKKLLQEPKVRFVGVIDWMGNLVIGNFRKGITPLKDESERCKMFIEAVLRVRTRQEFDYNMGTVEYAAARRKKVVTITFQLDDGILFISTDYDVDIDKISRKIMKIVGI